MSSRSIQPGACVLVTGARGFVGRAVVELLVRAGYRVRGSSRSAAPGESIASAVEWVQVDELSGTTDWSAALDGVDAVVHLAARVHQADATAAAALADHHRANTEGTLRLAESAAAAGVRRLLFLSSIKVNGRRTGRNDDGTWQRFDEDTEPHPAGAYARSKWAAEQGLLELVRRDRLAITILRPPLVYGPGGGYFLRLLHAVQRGMLLPFAKVENLRSLIYVENLADAARICLQSDAALNRTYLVCDVDVSTPDLIRAVAEAMHCRANLIPLPIGLLRTTGMLTLKTGTMSRLLDSLAIDGSRIRRELCWTPPFAMRQGLERTAAFFASAQTGANHSGAKVSHLGR